MRSFCLAAVLMLAAPRLSSAATLYFTESGLADTVSSVDTDDSSLTTIVPGVPGDPSVDPRGVAVDSEGGKVYYIRSRSLQRRNLDGSGAIEEIATDVGGTGLDVEIHDGRVYWSRAVVATSGTGIFSRKLDLSDAVTPVLTQADLNLIVGLDLDIGLTSVSKLEIANGLIYWNNGVSVNSVGLTGASPANVFKLASVSLSDFDIDDEADKIYFSDGQTKILRADLGQTISGDASGLETVRDFGFGFPGAITLDLATDTMYYARDKRLWSLSTSGVGDPVEVYNSASALFAVTDLEFVAAVPEPSSQLMALAGAASLGLLAARGRR